MPRLKEFECSACKGKHPRPVGRNCLKAQEAASASSLLDSVNDSVGSASSKSGSSSSISDDLAAKILLSLNRVNERLDGINKRDQKNEEAMAAKLNDSTNIRHSSPVASPDLQKASSLATQRVEISHPRDSVVPSLDFVRSNEVLQAQASS